MKKQILKIAFVSALSAIALLAGCEKPCEHTGGTATCTEPAVCELCGESYGEALGHSHATTWTYNETKHWNECACGDKANEADHNWIAGEITTQPTCTTVGQQNYACECGATKVEELPIQHEYATEWTEGETTHWKECECGAKTEETAHEYTTKGFDEAEHWMECVCGAKSEVAEHEFPEEPTIITPATGCKGHNAANPIMVNAGKQSYTCACGYAEEKDYWLPHVDTDGDITCDYDNTADGYYDCTSRILPEKDTEISVATATLIGSTVSASSKWYLNVTVTQIFGGAAGIKNGYFEVSDGTNTIFLRQPYNADGAQYFSWTTKICVGDTIQIYGTPTKNGNTSSTEYSKDIFPAEFYSSKATVTIISHTHSYSEATCTVPATCGCGSVNGTTIDHPDTDSNGRCDTCKYPIGAQVYSSNVNMSTGDENCGTKGTNEWTWDKEKFTFVVSKGGASGIYASSQTYARINKNNDYTVTAKDSLLIKRVVYTAESSSYVDEIQTVFEKMTGVTVSVVGLDVIIDFDTPVNTITARAEASSRITKVAIYY